MTAEEFKGDGIIVDPLEFAEAYKEHERKRYEALVRLTNSEEFDELELLLDEAIEDRDYFESERDKLQKKVEELKELLGIAYGGIMTDEDEFKIKQALKE